MRERSEEIGAELTITSQPENGTCVKLFVGEAALADAAQEPHWFSVDRSDARGANRPDTIFPDAARLSAMQEKRQR